MIDENDKKTIQEMIRTDIKKSLDYPFRKRGDTPTDDLQLVPKKYVDGLIAPYGGVVVNGAAGTPFPTGWSVANPSTGNYVITHNLGTTNYDFTITPYAIVVPNITNKSTNSFTVNFRNLAAADASTDFEFLVQKS